MIKYCMKGRKIMELDIFLIFIIFCCIIGFIRFIQLIYVYKNGFSSQLEYVNYSYSNIEPDGLSANNGYMGGESTKHYVKAKYRIQKGLYIYKTVPQSIFRINSLEPVDIIVFPNNDKKFILKNQTFLWILPIICTLILLIIVCFFVFSFI